MIPQVRPRDPIPRVRRRIGRPSRRVGREECEHLDIGERRGLRIHDLQSV